MPAYFVVELEITNQAAMEPYRAAVGTTIEQNGGRFLARAGATELIEGGPEPKRIVILEFADKAAFKRWYNSPEYQRILPGRLDNSTGRAFIVGAAPGREEKYPRSFIISGFRMTSTTVGVTKGICGLQ
jgi:uncharacterized protein (DUF1330 family)